MSAKSLLQIVLFLLIILILSLVYFLYFYKGPSLNNFTNSSETIEDISQNQNFSDNQEILDELKNNKSLKRKEEIDLKKADDLIDKKIKSEKNIADKNSKDIKNLTKEIEYITKSKEGSTFKVLAKYGKTNIKNTEILDLVDVDGTVTSKNRSNIYITSDYAKYNYSNQNSRFFDNVVIKYDNKVITCDNFSLDISENIAIAYDNVIVKDESSIMKAQNVTMNILTKDITINSEKKIKILTN